MGLAQKAKIPQRQFGDRPSACYIIKRTPLHKDESPTRQCRDRSCLGHLTLARVNWERARQIKDLVEAKPALEKSYEQVKRSLELNPNLAPAQLLKGNLLLRVARTTDALV